MSQETPRRRSPGQLRDLPADVSPARAALVQEMRKGRERTNLSLNDLARDMFSSKATVSRWLNARSLPDEKQAIRWAELCGTEVPTMVGLWQQASALEPSVEPGDAPSPPEQDTPPQPERERRRRRIVVILSITLLLCVAGVSITIWTKRSTAPPCAVDYPVSLYVPPQSGEVMDVTAEVKCGLAPDRKYLIVEEVPNVDLRNPHPAYYVKAQVLKTRIGESSVTRLILKEPVGMRAKFYVISVDAAGERQMAQNHIVDNGLLNLPDGARQESAVSWHVKAWQ
ncbi:helix-turn-helix transcriptional regulator [Streptosporangium sp. NPDC002524]|uniref:helix-turn-helix domain-containing protein n=1 Tax=Streptosporangium sp. NPDC002524 TaxID=3154537 RepID=UPI00333045F8